MINKPVPYAEIGQEFQPNFKFSQRDHFATNFEWLLLPLHS